MNLASLTSKDLAKIAHLLKVKESLLERVAKVDAKLSAFESGQPVAAAKGGKRKMSAAGRAAIAAAQKARWAKLKGRKAGKPAKRKIKFSAAGLARIRAAQKARWAKFKATKGD